MCFSDDRRKLVGQRLPSSGGARTGMDNGTACVLRSARRTPLSNSPIKSTSAPSESEPARTLGRSSTPFQVKQVLWLCRALSRGVSAGPSCGARQDAARDVYCPIAQSPLSKRRGWSPSPAAVARGRGSCNNPFRGSECVCTVGCRPQFMQGCGITLWHWVPLVMCRPRLCVRR